MAVKGIGIFEMMQMTDDEIDTIVNAERETEAELYARIRNIVENGGYRTTGNLEPVEPRLALAGQRVA